jgi:hypothetical protein
MYVEDILDNIVGFGSWMTKATINFTPYDRNMLESFSDQISRNLGFTEKQCIAVVKVLKSYKSSISAAVGKDVTPFLENPQFKLPKRTLVSTKSLKIEEIENNNKIIRVKFPYDEGMISSIKDFRKKQQQLYTGAFFTDLNSTIEWNAAERSWDFSLREDYILWLLDLVTSKGFTIDQLILDYAEEMTKILESAQDYVPMVLFDDKFTFKNTHKNIPQPVSTDLIDVLFDARQYGINTWDENIDVALDSELINPCTREFFKNTKSQFTVEPAKYDFSDLTDIVTKTGIVIFVIPGGSELVSLKHSHEYLKSIGITNEQVTVLFRLDSNAGKMCNDYVKDNQLNNHLNENIKFIFISIKVPKPIIANKIKIDAIINLGSNSAHYTVKNLLKQHHCVINYTIDRSTKEKNIGNV